MTSGSDLRGRLARSLIGHVGGDRRVPSVAAAPLSDLQRSLWIEQRITPTSCTYNAAMALEILGPIVPERWREALLWAVRRMPALNAIYPESAGGVERVPDPEDPIEIPIKDLPWRTGIDLRRLAQDFAKRPFDLQGERPFRAAILRAADDRWALLLCAHHIAWDGASLRTLLTLLEAGLASEPVDPEPPTRLTARDAPMAERRAQLPKRAETHFDGIDPDAAPVLIERSEDAGKEVGGEGEFLALEVPEAVVRTAAALARRVKCSRFHVFLAGLAATTFFQGQTGMFATVLFQRPDDPDGVAAAHGLKRLLVGFPNPEELSFEDLVGQCRDGFFDALELADLPESDLRAAFKAATGRFDFPLGRNLLSFDTAQNDRAQLGGLQIRVHASPPTAARANFGMSIIATGAGLSLRIEAKSRDGIARDLGEFGERYLADLARLLQSPDRKLIAVPPAHMAERRRLAAALKGPEAKRTPCVTQLLEEVAQRYPADPAILKDGGRVSYGDLRRQALAWRARIAAAAGDRPGAQIALAVRRDRRSIAALWGIWMAGGVAVLLDPSMEGRRLEAYLAQATLAWAIGPRDSDLRERIEASGISWLDLEWEGADASVAAPPVRPNANDDPAYQILTSGSTGEPKVVEITHGNLAQTLAAAIAFSRPLERPVCVWSASLAFDIALVEIFLPLTLGGSVRVHGAEPIDVGTLAREAQRSNIFHAVPSVMREVLKACGDGAAGPDLALVGGDKVTPDLLGLIRATWPETRVRVLYGPTETTIICASVEIPPSCTFDAPVIGRPHCNTHLRIVNGHGSSVPFGVSGELLIGGPVVGRYAIAESDQYARFLQCGSRQYFLTRDLVRLRPDGVIVFMGRCDEQEKIDGVRVMPEFVEATLRQLREFEEIAVVGYDAAPDARRLMAFYEPRPGAPKPEQSNLRARLADRLSQAAFPAHFEPMAALPVNKNGKVDRKALLRLAREIRVETAQADRVTEMQAMIAVAWSDVLGKPVTPGDRSFMALGGDSLAMSRLRVHLQERFGSAPSLAELMARPTIAGMAELVTSAKAAAEVPLEEPPTSAPLTAQQRQIWALARRLPLGAQMTIPLAFELSQACDPQWLEEAILGCLTAHDALAARIEGDDDVQSNMLRRTPEEIKRLFALETERAEDDATARRVLETFFRRGFDLERDLLVRFLYVERPVLPILALDIHHVISDGWSIDLLLRDIVRRYELLSDGWEDMAPPPGSFLGYSRGLAAVDGSARALSYMDHLDETSGVAVSLFDPERTGKRRASFIVFHRVRRLDSFDGRALDRLAARVSATPFVIGLAAYAKVVSKLAAVRTLRLALMSANRDSARVESMIGLLANTVLVDVDTTLAATDPRGYLHGVARALTGSLRFQNVYMSDLVACARDQGHDPKAYASAFQFRFLDHGRMTVRGRVLELTVLQTPEGWDGDEPEFKLTGYELATALRRYGNTLDLAATFQVDVFTPEQTDAILAQMEAALCGFADAAL